MKISRVELDAFTDVRRDSSHRSTQLDSGNAEYGVLLAYWGYGALNEGAQFEVHLCEGSFFGTLEHLRQ